MKLIKSQWIERDLGPSMLALANSFYALENAGKALSTHPLNHTIQPCGSWRGTYGDIVRSITRLTGLPVKHTILSVLTRFACSCADTNILFLGLMWTAGGILIVRLPSLSTPVRVSHHCF